MSTHTGRRPLAWIAWVAALMATMTATMVSPTGSAAAQGAPDDAGDPVSDPALVDAIESAPNGSARVGVEIVTADTDAAAAEALRLGGVITGSVPGEVLQVSMPSAKVELLAGEAAVDFVRSPLVANRPVHVQSSTGAARPELGPVVGQNVAITNAAAWHAAGMRGAVKVGIVDFFYLPLWNPAEHGPLPDAGHRLCLDTSGSGFCPATGVDGEEHGVAVAEVVKDIAPDAELYLATVGTASDLRVAIDWFAANGVGIITRSLGAAYDGPGDGTGPLGAVVDYAATKGITWFNSAGNDAAGAYGRYVDGVDTTGYVDFQPGPGIDTSLTVFPQNGCIGFDGVRWSDWGKAPAQVTDYRVELYVGGFLEHVIDADQGAGAPPLEATDFFTCSPLPVVVRIRRASFADGPTADIIEIGMFFGDLEHSQAAYSAAKPVVDSRNPTLVAVGAVDPAAGTSIGFYSSQGPTNDGRTKPDMAAPSCVTNTIYSPAHGYQCFAGTSAASPAAAGIAALLYAQGLAYSGGALAGLTRHFVTDLGPPGVDNSFGSGKALLPAPPAGGVDARPAQYVPLVTPTRILDTRPESPTSGAAVGPHPAHTVLEVPISAPGASAVAISIVSVGNVTSGYIQALPTLQGRVAASSNLNVATPGQIQPNFAIVPVGAGGSISLYLYAGGNVVVDLMGYFTPAATPTVESGRFVAVDPVRVLDTRPESGGPVPPGWVAHRPAAGETVRVTGIPAGASAAVVNVAADQAVGPGFLRTQPTGVVGLTTSNGNYVAGLASGTLSIVPVGDDGTISVFTSNSTHIVVDLMGYITGPGVAGSAGLLVPLTPTRAYDSRAGAGIHASLSNRTITVAGQAGVPAGASAVSMNLTSDAAVGAGYLSVFPADRSLPLISNLNYPAGDPRANAGMVRLSGDGKLNAFVNQTTHVIIDVNGYFTGS